MTRFDTTRWSMVMCARNDSEQARSALESLCRTYHPPVLEFIRRRGYAPDAAEDLAQTFFTHFIERAYYADADPNRGRFRAFLLIALKRFLIDADNEARTIKRGGRVRFKSLDDFENGNGADIGDGGETPENAFERCWAIALLSAAMKRLRKEATHAGKRELFEQLHEFLAERPDDADYERVATKLNMRRNTLAVAVHRMRHRLRELVREELAQTTVNQAELESEIRDLRSALGRAIG